MYSISLVYYNENIKAFKFKLKTLAPYQYVAIDIHQCNFWNSVWCHSFGRNLTAYSINISLIFCILQSRSFKKNSCQYLAYCTVWSIGSQGKDLNKREKKNALTTCLNMVHYRRVSLVLKFSLSMHEDPDKYPNLIWNNQPN